MPRKATYSIIHRVRRVDAGHPVYESSSRYVSIFGLGRSRMAPAYDGREMIERGS